jgi:hypothetical protein
VCAAAVGSSCALAARPYREMLFNDFWGHPLKPEGTDSQSKNLWWSHLSYRPLTVLTFRWNFDLNNPRGAMEPLPFHLTNILIHSLSCALVVPLLTALTGSRSEEGRRLSPSLLTLGAALLFASHPLHVEVVANVTHRAETLCAVFLFASWMAYDWAREQAELDGDAWSIAGALTGFLLAMGLHVLAILSKETAIVFPAVLVGVDLVQTLLLDLDPSEGPRDLVSDVLRAFGSWKRVHWDRISRWALVLVWAAVVFNIRIQFLTGGYSLNMQTMHNPIVGIADPLHRFLSIGLVQSTALSLMFWPGDWLSHEHNSLIPISSVADSRNLFTIAMFTFVGAWLVLAWKSDHGEATIVDDGLDGSKKWETTHSVELVLANGETQALGPTKAPYDEECMWDRARRFRILGGMGVLLVSYLPASHLLVVVGFVLAERQLFLPTIGASVLIAELILLLAQGVSHWTTLHRAAWCPLPVPLAVKIVTSRTEQRDAAPRVEAEVMTSPGWHQVRKRTAKGVKSVPGRNVSTSTTFKGVTFDDESQVIGPAPAPSKPRGKPKTEMQTSFSPLRIEWSVPTVQVNTCGRLVFVLASFFVVAAFTVRSMVRSTAWLTDEHLSFDTLMNYPEQNPMSYYGLAMYWLYRGQATYSLPLMKLSATYSPFCEPRATLAEYLWKVAYPVLVEVETGGPAPMPQMPYGTVLDMDGELWGMTVQRRYTQAYTGVWSPPNVQEFDTFRDLVEQGTRVSLAQLLQSEDVSFRHPPPPLHVPEQLPSPRVMELLQCNASGPPECPSLLAQQHRIDTLRLTREQFNITSSRQALEVALKLLEYVETVSSLRREFYQNIGILRSLLFPQVGALSSKPVEDPGQPYLIDPAEPREDLSFRNRSEYYILAGEHATVVPAHHHLREALGNNAAITRLLSSPVLWGSARLAWLYFDKAMADQLKTHHRVVKNNIACMWMALGRPHQAVQLAQSAISHPWSLEDSTNRWQAVGRSLDRIVAVATSSPEYVSLMQTWGAWTDESPPRAGPHIGHRARMVGCTFFFIPIKS